MTRKERTDSAIQGLGVYDLLPSDESGTHGLEAEVDSYLGISNRGEADTILFWEVSYIFNSINACLHDF